MTDYGIPDYYNFPSSLIPGPNEPAHVTFDVRWFDLLRSFRVDNAAQTFRGDFIETKVSCAWSSRNDSGFSFDSDPANTSQSLFGILGNERNGLYYNAAAPPVSGSGAGSAGGQPSSGPGPANPPSLELPATGRLSRWGVIGGGTLAALALFRRALAVAEARRQEF